MTNISRVKKALAPYQDALMNHKVYESLSEIEDLRLLMEQHVFAVWDFMSLLKALQIQLTCTQLPWMPSSNPTIRRLINDIVLEEESDVNARGEYASHFEMYMEAMEQAGANTTQMLHFIQKVQQGRSVQEALQLLDVSETLAGFVNHTFSIIEGGKAHQIAAAFTFGREDVIPSMFREIVKDMDDSHAGELSDFRYYLDRHIALDEEVHTPMAMQMISELCGDNEDYWDEVIQVSIACLQSRISLWDHIAECIENRQCNFVAQNQKSLHLFSNN